MAHASLARRFFRASSHWLFTCTFIMALFEVPGWKVPTDPVSVSKKRKRPKAPAEDDMAGAAVNVDKLMRSLDSMLAAESKGAGGSSTKGKAKAIIIHEDVSMSKPRKRKNVGESERKASSAPRTLDQSLPNKKKKERRVSEGKPQETKEPPRKTAPDLVSPRPGPREKKKKDTKKDDTSGPSQSAAKSAALTPVSSQPGMTALQAKMKSSLDGARFRSVLSTSLRVPNSLTIPQMDKRGALQIGQRTRTRYDAEGSEHIR